MAKVDNNIFVRGLSGSLGDQFVVRRGRGGRTVIANKSTITRTFNAVQLAHQDAFRMAIAYAKGARTQEVYVSKAEGTPKSSFNVAVADWFNEPEVLNMDASGWNGGIGQTLRIQAQDDTYVARVHVVIRDENGTILEEGDATRAEGLWWEYTTQTAVPMEPFPDVTAQAFDLAGNVGQRNLSN